MNPVMQEITDFLRSLLGLAVADLPLQEIRDRVNRVDAFRNQECIYRNLDEHATGQIEIWVYLNPRIRQSTIWTLTLVGGTVRGVQVPPESVMCP